MKYTQWTTIIDQLKSERSINFDDGLTDQEVIGVEQKFGFQFPSDLREFLQTALPVSPKFPNWRNDSEDSLRERLALPLEGVLFDVEYNNFWLQEWGPRPDQLEQAFDIVRRLIAAAPILIPIFSHRMIADRPQSAGNPVFSVHQTDIIYYGVNLRDYFIHEFFVDPGQFGVWPIPDDIRPIEFWDIRRFQATRWDENGIARFDNRRGILPVNQPARNRPVQDKCDLTDESGNVIGWRDAAFAVVVAVHGKTENHQIEFAQTLVGYQTKPGTARVQTTRDGVVKMLQDGRSLITAVFNDEKQVWMRGPIVQLTGDGFLQTNPAEQKKDDLGDLPDFEPVFVERR